MNLLSRHARRIRLAALALLPAVPVLAPAALALLLSGPVLAPAARAAEPWPAHAVTWIVPFSPGGSTDLAARIVAQPLSAQLGQPVTVENRAGAGGLIGVGAGARAARDGYTLTGGTISTHAINASLYRRLPYDPVRDFQPVALLGYVPNALMVDPALGIDSVAGLLAWLKSHPDAAYASSGAGTSTHLTGALLAQRTALPLRHVPYKGSPQALQDVAAGTVPFLFDQLTAGLPLVSSGRLKLLAVTSSARSPLAPDTPTMAEAGLPGFDLVSWQAVYAPAGTPATVTDRLSGAIRDVLAQPAVRAQLEQQLGMQIVAGTPDALAALMKDDIARLGELVRQTGASAD